MHGNAVQYIPNIRNRVLYKDYFAGDCKTAIQQDNKTTAEKHRLHTKYFARPPRRILASQGPTFFDRLFLIRVFFETDKTM